MGVERGRCTPTMPPPPPPPLLGALAAAYQTVVESDVGSEDEAS